MSKHNLAFAKLKQEIDDREGTIRDTQKEVDQLIDDLVSKKMLIRRLKGQKYELEQAISQLSEDI